MAKAESKGTGDLEQQRPQVQSSEHGAWTTDAAAGSNRGDQAASRSTGRTELPAQFGRYRVKKKLGGGGMGAVYLVENTELEREEALKVPHFADGDDPQLRESAIKEFEVPAELKGDKRAQLSKDIEDMNRFFKPEDVVAEAEILLALSKEFQLDDEKKDLFFYRNGNIAWLLAYVAEKSRPGK